MVLVSVLVFVILFLVHVKCGIFLIMMGPLGTGETRFVQTILNDSIQLEKISSPTKNNDKDDNIADEHRCFPSQERDGQLEEIVVLTSFIGQVFFVKQPLIEP